MSIARFHKVIDPASGTSGSPDAPPDRNRVEPEDAFLARSISRNDAAALERLLERYWEPLCSYASRILNDVALAEDVVQRMFVSLWSDRHTWSPRAVRSYLFRSTRNLALDELRSREARFRREGRVVREQTRRPRLPDAVLEESLMLEAVDDAIQQLPERRREAFTLVYLKQLSYAEVAGIMEISQKTVGHHVSAALAELRRLLRPIPSDLLEGVADQQPREPAADHPRPKVPKIVP